MTKNSGRNAQKHPSWMLLVPALTLVLAAAFVLFYIFYKPQINDTYIQVPTDTYGTSITALPALSSRPAGTGAGTGGEASGVTPSVLPTEEPPVHYLNDEEIEAMLKANHYDNEAQKELVDAAVSLIGKVHYFWGGKSTAIGMDPEWGKLRLVEGEGHETCGTEQPFGLDCSGYVNWCFVQLHTSFGLTPEEIVELIGNGTWNQWNNSQAIDKSAVRIGDIAFIHSYPTSRGNHVGICVGFDASGDPLIAQCSNTMNNVVVSTCEREFIYFRRPPVWDRLTADT